jgi:branched-chain amino acid transport system substrate-binding protein
MKTRKCGPLSRRYRRAGWVLLVPAGLLALASCGSSSHQSSANTVASGGGGSATTAGSGAAPATATLKIGEIDSLTGTFAQFGVPQHDAIELALNQIKAAGGLKVGNTTYNLSLVVEDDKTDAATGAVDMQKLLGENIHYFIGTLSSAVAEAYLPLIKNRTDIIDIVTGAADTGLNDNPPVYRPRVTQGQYVPAEVAEMRSLTSPSASPHVGNVYDQGNAGVVQAVPTLDSDMKAAGYSVNNEPFTAGQAQFGSQITGIKNAGDKAVFFDGNSSDCAPFIKEARQQGYSGLIVSTGLQAVDVKAANVPLSAMKDEYDVQAANPVDLQAAGQSVGTYDAFAQAYQAAYKSPPGFTSASAFDGAYILADALQKNGSVTNYAGLHTVLDGLTLSDVPQLVEAILPQGPQGLIFADHQSYFKMAVHTWNGSAFVLNKIITTT